MKYLLLVGGLLTIFSTGCVSVKINEEGMSYKRYWGDQKLAGVEVEKREDGTFRIKFDKQEGTGGDLAEMGKNLSEALLRVGGGVATGGSIVP